MVKTKKSKNKTISDGAKPAKLTWLPKKTFELELTILWSKVKQALDQAVKDFAQQTTIKGFRRGKAPLRLIKKKVDKQKLYQEAINKLLPTAYSQAVKKHNLRPVIAPKLTPISIKEGENWRFKAVSCERPEIKLNNYQKIVKAALLKDKIWLPGKDKQEQKKNDSQSYDQKLKIATKALRENIKVEIPDILIEDEVNRMLSRFLDQVNALGITVQQYLQSKGISSDQLKSSYRRQAEQTLSLEFILQAIVADRKIKVEKQEIDKMINAAPDKKVQEKLKSPLERAYLASIIAKRKVLDYLTNL